MLSCSYTSGFKCLLTFEKQKCTASMSRPEVYDCDLFLEMVVTRSHDMTTWTCEVTHEAFRGETAKQQKQIEVHYPPSGMGPL